MLIGAIMLAAGCSPGGSAFEREAEKTINGDDGQKLPVDVKDANCDTPSSTRADTTFPCQAVDEVGETWNFVAKITGANKFEIIAN
jgi:hypothetical protein